MANRITLTRGVKKLIEKEALTSMEILFFKTVTILSLFLILGSMIAIFLAYQEDDIASMRNLIFFFSVSALTYFGAMSIFEYKVNNRMARDESIRFEAERKQAEINKKNNLYLGSYKTYKICEDVK